MSAEDLTRLDELTETGCAYSYLDSLLANAVMTRNTIMSLRTLPDGTKQDAAALLEKVCHMLRVGRDQVGADFDDARDDVRLLIDEWAE